MQLKIEYVDTSQLKTYVNNAKVHTAEQIEQIKKSIEEFGFNDPIAVWKDNEIIEGHGRLIAATELGIESVPVIRLDDLTDEQRRAYMLVHNKLTMNTDFDIDVLNGELEDILSIDMESFGFTLDDDGIDDFEVKEEEKPEVKFTEVLGEEHNYIVLYFDNEVDWLQAQSLFDIQPRRNLSTRTDGVVTKGMERISTGRVLNGAEAMEKIREYYEDIN